jgi:DNA-binding NarL/FixJ family response regulator
MATDKVKEDLVIALEGFNKLYNLSRRESDILGLLVNKVVSAEAIASELGISRNTVRIHFQNIFAKMTASSKSEVLGKFIDYVVAGSYLKTKPEIHHQINVVVVDDDQPFKDLVKRAIEQLVDDGLTYTELANGLELVQYIASGTSPRPDLILLDLNMPVVDGYAALTELKQNSATRDIPVVVFTSSQEPEDVRRIYEIGANSFVAKPAGFHALQEVLRGILSYWCELGELPTKDGVRSVATTAIKK